jgi:hypothetical protein
MNCIFISSSSASDLHHMKTVDNIGDGSCAIKRNYE